MPVEVENDPFFQLLTDALRAGPASPPWREAVAKLRESGEAGGASAAKGADEYRLLIEARQNLEVGKSYRAVRPGPAFTRKVLSGVEESPQAGGGRRIPIAGIVAVLAGLVLVAVITYMVHIMAAPGPESTGAVDELAGTYFPITVASVKFSGALPADLRKIGGLQLTTENIPVQGDFGLHVPFRAKSGDDILGGGVALAQPLQGDEAFEVEARGRPSLHVTDQIAEVFVSTSPDFSSDRATAPHELVWLIRGYTQQVVLDGRVVAERPFVHIGPLFDVRIAVNKDLAVVESYGGRIWAGPHGLGAGPRYVGVRILTTRPGVVGDSSEPDIIDWKVAK